MLVRPYLLIPEKRGVMAFSSVSYENMKFYETGQKEDKNMIR